MAPARRTEGPHSNPGPGENFSLKSLIYDLSEGYLKLKFLKNFFLLMQNSLFLLPNVRYCHSQCRLDNYSNPTWYAGNPEYIIKPGTCCYHWILNARPSYTSLFKFTIDGIGVSLFIKCILFLMKVSMFLVYHKDVISYHLVIWFSVILQVLLRLFIRINFFTHN